MEQIIEFPVSAENMFDDVIDVQSGYCICYQHDVDAYGYGPYGFDTAKADRWLKKTFPSLVYWDSDRQKLIDVDIVRGRGIYFYKDQEYVKKIQQELLDYERALKTELLRARYKKLKAVNTVSPMPAILTVSNNRLFPAKFLTHLLGSKCVFFIVYSMFPYTGQTLVTFDSLMHEHMKKTAATEGVFYQMVETIDKIKPW